MYYRGRMTAEAHSRQDISGVIAEYGEFAHGGEPIEHVVPEWMWATPQLVRAFLDVRCFDGVRASMCPAVGLTPSMLSERVEFCGYDDTLGYHLANGDVSVSQARAMVEGSCSR